MFYEYILGIPGIDQPRFLTRKEAGIWLRYNRRRAPKRTRGKCCFFFRTAQERLVVVRVLHPRDAAPLEA